jgi:hypothetical protein
MYMSYEILCWHIYCIKEEQDIKQFYVANSEKLLEGSVLVLLI